MNTAQAERILKLYRLLATELDTLDMNASGRRAAEQEATRENIKREMARLLFMALANAGIDSRTLRLAGRIDEDREGKERSEMEARGGR